jgi:thymidylate synthase
MKQYIDLVTRIIKEGHESGDRTGVGTTKIFGHQSTYDMDDGFPLLTLKKTWMPGVTHELLWLLGNHTKLDEYKDLSLTNIKYLTDNKVHIWDEWADDDGDLGPVYGKQWVNWKGREYDTGGWGKETVMHNQIQTVVDKLTKDHDNFNPMDRGLVVSAWNVGELDQMALRPCHAFFQFQARELSQSERYNLCDESMDWGDETELDDLDIPKYELSLQLYQRSADTFLGVPFNIASYSLLLHMVCHVTGMKPGKFVHTFGDAHLYSNHKDQVNKMLTRTNEYDLYGRENPDVSGYKDREEAIDYWNKEKSKWRPGIYDGPELPELWLNPEIKNIFDFQYKDIKVLNYNPLPAIKAKVAV